MDPVTLIWEGEGERKKEVVDERKKFDAARLVSFPSRAVPRLKKNSLGPL